MSIREQKADADDIEALFAILLGRPVRNDRWKAEKAASGVTVADLIAQIRQSNEYVAKAAVKTSTSQNSVDDYRFRLPQHLALMDSSPKRVLLVGSCLMNPWTQAIQSHSPSTRVDRVVFNNASALPPFSADDARQYDFQIVQIPLRSILKEGWYLSLPAGELQNYERLYARACEFLDRNLEAALAYHRDHGVAAFVLGLPTPQQNPLGRSQDRYSFENMIYFVEKLNERLYRGIASRRGAHFIDMDQIAATFGKKYFQDDTVLHLNHGSCLADIRFKEDHNRLEPVGDLDDLYGPRIDRYILAAFQEACAIHRSERQIDAVKLVIFDLDDTLWRGIAAEMDEPDAGIAEGWPLGVLEAASYLWKRGVLIAIVSKNDEGVARKIWGTAYGPKFGLDKFVCVKINWRPKAENIAEILRETNLLPNSVLLVDDNPVERANVKGAFPEMRTLEAPLIEWRRTLLWSAELQRAAITDEAAARTQTVQSQIQREAVRSAMTHEDFLRSLQLRVRETVVRNSEDPRFARCFELLNKTNQFNTTGRRWTASELEHWLAEGGYCLGLDVSDAYANYGLSGVVVIMGDVIEQCVLSCRVFGLGVEHAAIAAAHKRIGSPLRGRIRATDKNRLSMALFANLGFSETSPGEWRLVEGEVSAPSHIFMPAGLAPA